MEYDDDSQAKIRKLIGKALTLEELNIIFVNLFPQAYYENSDRTFSYKVINLVECAIRKVQVPKLLQQIKETNPHRYEEYIDEINHEDSTYIPPEPKYFDLRTSISQCRDEIPDDKKGVIGLLVASVSDRLIDHFPNRLKEDLSVKNKKVKKKKKIILKSIQTLAHNTQSIDGIVEYIRKHIPKSKEDKTIIFRIVARESDPIELWNKIQQSFPDKDKLSHCLVIIIFSNLSPTSIPNDVISVNPKFKESQLCDWIDVVIEELNTSQRTGEWIRVSDEWKKIAKKCCKPDSMDNLDIESVYQHLEKTLKLIKDDSEILPEDFLEEIRIEEYYHV